jgi:hypothetical protein
VDILPLEKETFLPGSKPCDARRIDHLIPGVSTLLFFYLMNAEVLLLCKEIKLWGQVIYFPPWMRFLI